jgi:4-aminobutyrate aminotransferase-like enzyme
MQPGLGGYLMFRVVDSPKVELVKDQKKAPATAEANAIRESLFRHGALVGVGRVSGNVIRFQPPL